MSETGVDVGWLEMGGVALDTIGLREAAASREGRLMLNLSRPVEVGGGGCRQQAGCSCRTSRLTELICRQVECRPAVCSAPLRPAGHCCWDYCGAVVTVESRASLAVLQRVVAGLTGSHTTQYIRPVGPGQHEILLRPAQTGNLTRTQATARQLRLALLSRVRARAVRVEVSGAGPPAGPAARAAATLGWVALVSLLLLLAARQVPRSRWPQLPDWAALRQRARSSGFARFTNQLEGEVELGGLAGQADNTQVILNPADLKQELGTMSFSNPLFNTEPPANLYSAEPRHHTTGHGLENPTYVAVEEVQQSSDTTEESHYEVVDVKEESREIVSDILVAIDDIRSEETTTNIVEIKSAVVLEEKNDVSDSRKTFSFQNVDNENAGFDQNNATAEIECDTQEQNQVEESLLNFGSEVEQSNITEDDSEIGTTVFNKNKD